MKKNESLTARRLTGYLSAIGAMTMLVTSSSCVQALRGAVPDFQLSVARALVQVLLYIIGGKLVGVEFRVKQETIPGLFNLGLAYMAINVGLYGAATYLPLTDVAGISRITAIVTTFLISRFLCHKEIKKSNIVSFLVCTVGIVLIVQPAWLFKQSITYYNMTALSFENVSYAMNSSACSSNQAMPIGYVLSIVGGVGIGTMYYASGVLLQGVKPVVKATYAAAFCVLNSVAFMFYMEEPVLMINMSQSLLVLGHAVMSALSSFFVIQAAHFAPGPSLALVFSFELVAMLVFQYTIMHSILPGNYNWIEVFGCAIIIFGAGPPAILDLLAQRAKADELP